MLKTMNLYHIKLNDYQKAALLHLFSMDITWNKTELENAWDELIEQVRESSQSVAIINALQDSGETEKSRPNTTPVAGSARVMRLNISPKMAGTFLKPKDYLHKGSQ